jgi:hypothetical protein
MLNKDSSECSGINLCPLAMSYAAYDHTSVEPPGVPSMLHSLVTLPYQGWWRSLPVYCRSGINPGETSASDHYHWSVDCIIIDLCCMFSCCRDSTLLQSRRPDLRLWKKTLKFCPEGERIVTLVANRIYSYGGSIEACTACFFMEVRN